MKHLKSISVMFFISAYATSVAMYFEDALFLKFGGVALALFLTYQLVDKYQQR
jgi:hypothetical protein